jgi:hypothetical protein
MHLCVYMDRGEDADSEAPSLMSYTLRYVSLTELGTLCRVGFQDLIHLCGFVNEEGGYGEGVDLELFGL